MADVDVICVVVSVGALIKYTGENVVKFPVYDPRP